MSIFALRSNGLASSVYKNLSRAQTSLNDNISRLASGLRINETADDSAGSNVSVRMGNQVSGMAQANRNAQDTNNLLATAESGLSNISDILGKMRELSVQASTDTLNDVDRASINLELQALKDELTRISNATEYNGMNVLNGSYQSDDGRGQWRIQIGADNDTNNQHQFSLMDASYGTGQDSTSSVESSLEVTSSSNVTFTGSGQSLGSSTSIEASLGDVDDDGDLDAFVANLDQANKVWINDGNGTFTNSGQSLGASDSVGISLGDVDDDGDLDAFVTNYNNQANKVWINDGRNDVGDITLNQAEAGAYTLTYDGTNTFSLSRDGGTAVNYVLTTDPASTGSSETASFNLDGNDINIELKQGYAQLDSNDFTFNVQNTTTYNANVLSVDDARTAITAIDHAIDEVNQERSYIGSEQNKLQFTMSNLSSNIQNIEASRSSIEDADFAAEAADLAKNQILAQSTTAMLAQASAISQNVLGLLA